MRKRATRHFAAVLSLLLLAVVPAQAGPVRFAEVVQVIGGLQGSSQSQELRLRAIQQQGGSTPVAQGTTPQQTPGTTTTPNKSTSAQTDAAGATTPGASDTPALPSSLINTAVQTPQQSQGQVEVIDEGDVAGTVCDCGEIQVPGGGFPKWPLIPLVGLVCLTGICTPDDECVANCNPCVGPNCNPPVPEPATLILFGSGLAALGASARRRYARVKLEKQEAHPTEV